MPANLIVGNRYAEHTHHMSVESYVQSRLEGGCDGPYDPIKSIAALTGILAKHGLITTEEILQVAQRDYGWDTLEFEE